MTRKFKENLPPIIDHHYKDKTYKMSHTIYDLKQLDKVQFEHYAPETFKEKYAFYLMKFFRVSFDFVTNYGENKMNAKKWMFRFCFLETLAGVNQFYKKVPGMVAAMSLHLKSLRSFKPDQGYIHTLLQEAENERMHLFVFLYFRKPGRLFRYAVILTQGVFWIFYYGLNITLKKTNPYQILRFSFLKKLIIILVHYALSPKIAHKFVSYLEEEAVRTYTHALKDIDSGQVPEFEKLQLSLEMKQYWNLPDDATFRDLILCIRADEACHREVNKDMSTLAGRNYKDKNIYEEI